MRIAGLRRSLLVASLGVLPVVAVSCGGSSSPSGAAARRASHFCPKSVTTATKVNDQGVAKATGATISVTAKDSFFFPTCITDASPGKVTLTVTNDGSSLHNITIGDQGIDQDIEPGKTVTVEATVGSSPLGYYCKYHKASGMAGAVIPVH